MKAQTQVSPKESKEPTISKRYNPTIPEKEIKGNGHEKKRKYVERIILELEKVIKDLEEIMKYEKGEGEDNKKGEDKAKGEEAKVARGLTTHLQLLQRIYLI